MISLIYKLPEPSLSSQCLYIRQLQPRSQPSGERLCLESEQSAIAHPCIRASSDQTGRGSAGRLSSGLLPEPHPHLVGGLCLGSDMTARKHPCPQVLGLESPGFWSPERLLLEGEVGVRHGHVISSVSRTEQHPSLSK